MLEKKEERKRKMKTFKIKINEGDAVIKLNSNKGIELIFGEDEETAVKEMEWEEQEVYKTSILFALMIDTYFRNGEKLDELIMHSPTGNIPAEILGKGILSITLAGADISEEELLKRPDDMKDNVVDATTRFTKDE